MSGQPLVSVIIPNYNHARYLPERMESVFGQTYKNIEVIILDDCSTDNSRNIIEQYKGFPQVSQVVYNKENSGRVFRQWKKGLTLAKGDLLWIAESDDKCKPMFLEELVRCFINDPSLSLAFCRSLLFNDTGKTWTLDMKELKDGVFNSDEFISDCMSRGCPMLNASSCLFSKKAFEKIDDYYTEFRNSGDRLFWTLIAERGNIAVVGDRLNYFRQHGNNTTTYGYRHGINQRESKYVLDYIRRQGYIRDKTYREIRRRALKKFVYNYIKDKQLKQELYHHWNFNYFQQMSLRLEDYYEKIKRKISI